MPLSGLRVRRTRARSAFVSVGVVVEAAQHLGELDRFSFDGSALHDLCLSDEGSQQIVMRAVRLGEALRFAHVVLRSIEVAEPSVTDGDQAVRVSEAAGHLVCFVIAPRGMTLCESRRRIARAHEDLADGNVP